MKIGSFLAVVLHVCLLATPVCAYGVRGVAERALYYIAYLMEEIHQDNSKKNDDGWKIAPDCKGGRKGLFVRDKTRCNLADFLDYIWAPSADGDIKPDKNRLNWGNSMTGAKDVPGIVGIISGLQNPDKPEGLVNTTPDSNGKVCWGYQGKIAVNKMWPGTGITTYQDSLAAFGQRVAQLNAEMDEAVAKDIVGDPSKEPVRNPGESEKDFKDRKKKWEARIKRVVEFRALFAQAKDASLVIENFRLQDSWRHVKNDPDWKSKLGIDPVWDTKTGSVGKTVIGDWEEINKEETIKKMMSELGMSREQATAKYDKEWAIIEDGENYKAHQAAIQSAQATRKDMERPPPPKESCG